MSAHDIAVDRHPVVPQLIDDLDLVALKERAECTGNGHCVFVIRVARILSGRQFDNGAKPPNAKV